MNDIPRVNVGSRVQLEDFLHGFVEHTDKSWNTRTRCRQVALTIGDARAHVKHFVNDRAHGGFSHRGEHLVADGLQGILDDLERDRVKFFAAGFFAWHFCFGFEGFGFHLRPPLVTAAVTVM